MQKFNPFLNLRSLYFSNQKLEWDMQAALLKEVSNPT